MIATELFTTCKRLGLTVYREKHALGAGQIIVANKNDEVQWAGASLTDALEWLLELELQR